MFVESAGPLLGGRVLTSKQPGIRAQLGETRTCQVDQLQRTVDHDSAQGIALHVAPAHRAQPGDVPEGFNEGAMFIASGVEYAIPLFRIVKAGRVLPPRIASPVERVVYPLMQAKPNLGLFQQR